MRTTVAISEGWRIVTTPTDFNVVLFEVLNRDEGGHWVQRVTLTLTPDQAGALTFGIEQAAEATRIANERLNALGI